MSKFESNYGYFDEAAREYVITDPRTPRPWVNVICPGDWGVILSQTGGGYSWRQHASLNSITRWSQDLVRDSCGKYVYVRDDCSGEIWSLSWMPVKHNPDRYAVRHGLGYSVIESETMGISSKLTVAVPPGEPLEVWLVELVNEGSVDRKLSLFTYLEWCLGMSPDWHREFHRTFIETSIDQDINTIWAQKRLWEIPNDKGTAWNRSWEYTAFHASSLDALGFECDKECFLGMYGDLSKPIAVTRSSLTNSCGKWTDPVGSIHVRITIPAGQSRKVAFVLGAVEAGHEGEARTLIAKYFDAGGAVAALARASQLWSGLLEPYGVQTPDEALDLMQNTWLPYQAISCRLWGRAGYYQPGGAYGFRDQLQDSQIFLPLDPSQTAKQIKLHAAHQYTDGHVDHWWHPISELGGGGLYSDDLLWLPYVTIGYLKETGDYTLLDVEVPYRDGDSESVWMHCIRALDLSLSRRSERGLPLILDGDWNDGMNAVGVGRHGESIWVAEFLCTILPDIAYLALLRGDSDLATRYAKEQQALADAVNTYGWSSDGGWYIRAVCDDGTPIGDPQCKYGKVFLNAQVWAVISGIATDARAKSAWQAVVKHLSTDAGPVLFAPAYAEPDERIGYLTRYAPGIRENGGRYTHAAAWAIMAAAMVGDSLEAWRMYHQVCPVRCGSSPDVYKVEPYVTPGNVAGPDSDRYCEGGWTWYTGSAAWLFRVGSEWLLGIRPEWDGLRIDPCIPQHWGEFHVKRRFRGSTYIIHVRNPKHVSSGVSKITIDGGEVKGSLLPALGDGKVHLVEVTLG